MESSPGRWKAGPDQRVVYICTATAAVATTARQSNVHFGTVKFAEQPLRLSWQRLVFGH